MKNDRMTSSERLAAIFAGKNVDRIPLFPFLLGFCAKNVGYPVSTIYSDVKKSYDVQQKTLEHYGFDWGPIYGYASYGTWEFGGTVSMPSGGYEQAPAHTLFPVNSEEDVEALQLPDITRAGCIPLAMEFSRLQKMHSTPISIVLGGNFTIAGNICPVEKLCRWMLKKPELFHAILRLSTDHIVDAVRYWADTFGTEQVIPMLWEPLAANLIISPGQFKQFVLPYLMESSEKILGMGIRHILYHICGDQKANLPYWAQVPMGDPGLCSFGKEIDITEAIKYLGNKAIIIGNIDPGLLLTESAEVVYNTCREIIIKGKGSSRGFMFSSGCEVSPETPGYNVFMMRKAIDNYGWYD